MSNTQAIPDNLSDQSAYTAYAVISDKITSEIEIKVSNWSLSVKLAKVPKLYKMNNISERETDVVWRGILFSIHN